MRFILLVKKCFIGFSYGISFPLTIVLLDYWLKDCGVTNTAIGLFALFHIPFSLKFLFAPLVDEYEIPYLSKIIGRRRSWVVFSQFLLIFSVLFMAQLDPKDSNSMYVLMITASIVALSEGLQNIALYPYQISDITKDQYGYTAGVINFGHKIGMIAMKLVTLYCAHFFGWKIAYEFAAFMIFCCTIPIFFINEPLLHESINELKENSVRNNRKIANQISIKNTYAFSSPISPLKKIIEAINRIIKRKNSAYTIAILLLYKATDFTIQKMSRAFCLEIGFSKLQIANIVQFFGSISVILGGFSAGFVIKKIGLTKSMIIVSSVHMIFLFFYVYLNCIGNNSEVLCLVIFLEGISGGAVSTAFIAFLYEECKNSSRYALFWAIHELGGTFFRIISGFLVDYLGWRNFFIVTPIMSIPCIAILINKMKEEEENKR